MCAQRVTRGPRRQDRGHRADLLGCHHRDADERTQQVPADHILRLPRRWPHLATGSNRRFAVDRERVQGCFYLRKWRCRRAEHQHRRGAEGAEHHRQLTVANAFWTALSRQSTGGSPMRHCRMYLPRKWCACALAARQAVILTCCHRCRSVSQRAPQCRRSLRRPPAAQVQRCSEEYRCPHPRLPGRNLVGRLCRKSASQQRQNHASN